MREGEHARGASTRSTRRIEPPDADADGWRVAEPPSRRQRRPRPDRCSPASRSSTSAGSAGHLDDVGKRIVQHLQLTIIPLVARVRDLAGPGDLGRPPAAGLRPGHRDHRPPVHDPEPGRVRLPAADLRAVAAHGGHPADDLHAAHPVPQQRRRASTPSRPRSSRRPRAWATPVGSGCSGWSCRWPCP